ncbi:MAG: MBL fold metallo-hydrolase, partial [Chloroflexi bacterium]|nr:MBL fold metallo-hydrolase [Chloroflexota bacterium]
MALDPETTITWHGHACVEVHTPGRKTILLDPWFGNPKSDKPAADVHACDLLLVTHGHSDHFGEALSIASRLRPTWP